MVLMKRRRNNTSHLLHQSDDSSSSDSRQIYRRVKSPQPQPPQTQMQKRKYVCEFCDKEFSSGKAYGGHVRIHSNEYRNKGKTKTTPRSKLKRKKENEESTRADVEGEIRCCICGKEFETMNSLFGHMRRHPERSWKGIRPPAVENFKVSSSSSSANFDDDDDVMSRSTVMDDVAEDVQEGACNLMLLSCGKTQKDEVKISRKGKEVVHNHNDNDDDDSDDDDNDDDDDDDDDDDEEGYEDDEMQDVKGWIVDRKIKMENEVKEEKKENGNGKRFLEIDLNKPCKIE